MSHSPYTRPTLVAAAELLEHHTQAKFDQMILRLGLQDEIPSGTGLSVAKKCYLLGREVTTSGDKLIDTIDGTVTLSAAVIQEAVHLLKHGSEHPEQVKFLRGLSRDGYTVSWDEYDRNPQMRASLPEEIQLPDTDDEVRQLLKEFDFSTSLGHLTQAIDNHTQGKWAAGNGQLRTFLESLFDSIAIHLRSTEASQLTSENRRSLLAQIGFLASDRNEWTADGKNYINGLFKMLHTEGSHPGLSDEDHCTFRLHIVLVTARTFLRRLKYEG